MEIVDEHCGTLTNYEVYNILKSRNPVCPRVGKNARKMKDTEAVWLRGKVLKYLEPCENMKRENIQSLVKELVEADTQGQSALSGLELVQILNLRCSKPVDFNCILHRYDAFPAAEIQRMGDLVKKYLMNEEENEDVPEE